MATSSVCGPLGPPTDRALLAAAQAHDRRAQDELVRRYDPLVQGTVRRMRLPASVDREDVAQEARIGLLAAVRAWRPGRAPFPAFAARCVRNRVIVVLNNAGRNKHRVLDHARSLDAPPAAPHDGRPGDSASYESVPVGAGDPEATALAHEQLEAICAALPTLTVKERAALRGSLNGRSQQDLADEFGGTAKAFALALRRARDKLAACRVLAA
jgi:RNA polymerase sporulation-specific sigma factor